MAQRSTIDKVRKIVAASRGMAVASIGDGARLVADLGCGLDDEVRIAAGIEREFRVVIYAPPTYLDDRLRWTITELADEVERQVRSYRCQQVKLVLARLISFARSVSGCGMTDEKELPG